MADEEEAETIAKTLQSMDTGELARRIREQATTEAIDALRRLVHPETGEPLRLKGVEASNPPRHEEGSLSDRK